MTKTQPTKVQTTKVQPGDIVQAKRSYEKQFRSFEVMYATEPVTLIRITKDGRRIGHVFEARPNEDGTWTLGFSPSMCRRF
ncbi:MAG: hypothetical protein BWY85_02244 [Firmicutes bacterium ADurb.Bin506]|nr:MAG: hypothetical protein BWY85_02244 [Firmicutes bacterium ADurb.Bin506]